MDRMAQFLKHQPYIEANGLNELINFKENMDYREAVFDSVSGDLAIPFPPEADDLVRLHKLIRKRKPFTILEFGTGYSTIVMAHALNKNMQEWESLADRPAVRNRFMFQIFSVDASKQWLATMEEEFPSHLAGHVHFHHSDVEIGTFKGQLCHYYSRLPDIVPDFVYLDAPHIKDVKGSINGLSFDCKERTVMAADLLLMESTFLPGTYILVDGRTNNARFLARNFTREFRVRWDKSQDITSFELTEDRLGKYNLLGSDFY